MLIVKPSGYKVTQYAEIEVNIKIISLLTLNYFILVDSECSL